MSDTEERAGRLVHWQVKDSVCFQLSMRTGRLYLTARRGLRVKAIMCFVEVQGVCTEVIEDSDPFVRLREDKHTVRRCEMVAFQKTDTHECDTSEVGLIDDMRSLHNADGRWAVCKAGPRWPY